MFLVRLLGNFFLLIAAMSAINDGGLTLTRGKGLLVTPLGQHWFDISPASLDAAEKAVTRLSPWLWDSVVVTILLYPGWLVFGLIGIVICYLGRKRERINIFAN